jgi:hypothetical protein
VFGIIINLKMKRSKVKLVKKIILTIFILAIFAVLFRGWIYRYLVTYKTVGQRQNCIATDKKLVNYIEINIAVKKEYNIKEVIELGLLATLKLLNFTTTNTDYVLLRLFYA